MPARPALTGSRGWEAEAPPPLLFSVKPPPPATALLARAGGAPLPPRLLLVLPPRFTVAPRRPRGRSPHNSGYPINSKQAEISCHSR